MQDPLESERLAALERLEVLDTPPEPLFDSLTNLAALSFNTPIALISLVDQDRQWFKSCVGLDARHTARDISFCQHAILADAPLVVPNALEDERFRHGPLVVGPPNIRFYAGAPLITPQGYRLGTLCVIDTVARDFTDGDAARLQAIAKSVMQALLLRLDSRERERIAAVSAQQTKQLKLAEEMAGVGTWSWDVAADRTTWSDQTYRIHGYEPGVEPPPLQGVLARYHPDDAKALATLVQRAVAEGRDYDLEARIYQPNGAERHVIARGACRKDANGAVTSLVGTFQDVTEHVSAERFIRTVTDSLPGMVAYWDCDLRCRFANAAYGEWFGRTSESMLGITLPELLGTELFAKNEPYVRGVLSGHRQGFARSLIKPNGDVGHTWANYIPDIDASGRTQGFIVLVSDFTELKKAEEKLQETNALLEVARDEAEAATAVKSEFLANMSHEIRTPLTAIIGFTGLLAERPNLDEVARGHLQRVATASRALNSLVNDVLDFSKLEAGQFEYAAQAVNPVEFAHETLLMFSPQANAKGLTLDFIANGELPDWLSFDPDRVRQILLNLVGNAIKFTSDGYVRLEVSYALDGARLRIAVADTGPGMASEDQAKLFQRFAQIDGSNTRKHGGTGLGLAISKGLVEAMGGQIGVTSELGRGSVFAFYITAPVAEAPAAAAEAAAVSLDGVRVLVVDDNPVNCEVARAVLEHVGAEVTLADGGATALRAAAVMPFDVILLDYRMPEMDGPETLRRLRACEGPNRGVPVIGFSADSESAGMAGRGGFDGFVAKPINAAALITAVMTCTEWSGDFGVEVADAASR